MRTKYIDLLLVIPLDLLAISTTLNVEAIREGEGYKGVISKLSKLVVVSVR